MERGDKMRIELVAFIDDNTAVVKTEDGKYFHLDNVKSEDSSTNIFSGRITLDFNNIPYSINPALDKKAKEFLDSVKEFKIV